MDRGRQPTAPASSAGSRARRRPRWPRAAGKPILYDFTAAWCGPCKLVDRDWEDARVADQVNDGLRPVAHRGPRARGRTQPRRRRRAPAPLRDHRVSRRSSPRTPTAASSGSSRATADTDALDASSSRSRPARSLEPGVPGRRSSSSSASSARAVSGPDRHRPVPGREPHDDRPVADLDPLAVVVPRAAGVRARLAPALERASGRATRRPFPSGSPAGTARLDGAVDGARRRGRRRFPARRPTARRRSARSACARASWPPSPRTRSARSAPGASTSPVARVERRSARSAELA